MGGRGSMMNVSTFGTKSGTRFSPAQYKEAVHAKANFVFRKLEQDDAIQIILKKNFKNGVPVVEISSDGVNIIIQRRLGEETVKKLTALSNEFKARKNEAFADMHSSKTWSGYDESRAERQVYLQAMKTLDEAIEELKKRR